VLRKWNWKILSYKIIKSSPIKIWPRTGDLSKSGFIRLIQLAHRLILSILANSKTAPLEEGGEGRGGNGGDTDETGDAKDDGIARTTILAKEENAPQSRDNR